MEECKTEALCKTSTFVPVHEVSIRNNFIAKVYSLLSCQLFLTFSTVCTCMFVPVMSEFVIGSPELNICAIIFQFTTLILLYCYQHKHPQNICLLFLFTFCVSYSIAYTCVLYKNVANSGIVIATAVGITFVDFISLTCYVLYSKRDFEFIRGGLCIGAFTIFIFCFLSILFPELFSLSESICGILGSLLFSGFVLYDTSQIIHHMDIDDYVTASVQLYLDIINLFLCVVQFLSYKNE
jgi:FtsH-binding integral membrane protein